MHIKRTKKSVQKHPMYYLLPQKRELDRVKNKFIRDNDQKGLAEWRLQQEKCYKTQLKLEHPQIEDSDIFLDQEPLLPNPFPEKNIVRGWDFFVSLYEEENSLEQVGELFHERRDLICQKLREWRVQVEAQLVEQYRSSFSEGASLFTDADTTLTVRGSTDATKHLSKNARFLLRADTVFMPKSTASPSDIDLEHGPVAGYTHFPSMPCITNHPDLFHVEFTDGFYQGEQERALDCYVRHAAKETIVKALLRQLQMPDVAYIELENMGRVFVCGRCDHGRAMEWYKLVRHYHLKRRDWVDGRFVRNTYGTRHPITFRNVHDLELGTNPKPLVRVVPSEENSTPLLHSHNTVAECIICRGVNFYEDSAFESLAKMREHMLEVHDTAEPVEDLHFMGESRTTSRILYWVEFDERNWEQKWDTFHDNQGASSGTSHEAEIQPQSASSS
ncbi:hypothetical protein FRC11_012762 [Ceratobasidium sp. 423]|nr:hypothetical protein FRC11_012762 [Ceratobasidium sp. 423]